MGGENCWTYDSFVNYDFFPEGWIDKPQGPILVYFKFLRRRILQKTSGMKGPAKMRIRMRQLPKVLHKDRCTFSQHFVLQNSCVRSGKNRVDPNYEFKNRNNFSSTFNIH